LDITERKKMTEPTFSGEDYDEIDLRAYLGVLLRWAWLVILLAVVAGASVFIYSKRQPPVYQASATMLIDQTPNMGVRDLYSPMFNKNRVNTYCALMLKRPFLEEVVKKMGVGGKIDAAALSGSLKIKPIRNTEMILVVAKNQDPLLAAQIANTILKEFIQQNKTLQGQRFKASKKVLQGQLGEQEVLVQEAKAAIKDLGDNPQDQVSKDHLEEKLSQYRITYTSLLQSYEQVRLAEAQTIANLVQVEPALPPKAPIRPRVKMNTMLAFIVGLMLGVGIAFLIEALDDTVKGPDEISRNLGLSVLGVIPSFESKDRMVPTVAQPRSPISEAFRSLRTNIEFASVDHSLRSLIVTSPSPNDGKSTIVVNMGVVLAQGGRRVVLMDTDFRKSTIHRLMGLPNREGLSSVFIQPKVCFDGNLQQTSIPELLLLSAGDMPPNPSELLGSNRMSEILGNLQEEVDMVLIDTAPVTAVTDPAVLASKMDGVLLVVRPRVTKLAACKHAVEQLRRGGGNLLGVILNNLDTKHSRYYHRYYNHYPFYFYHKEYSDYYGDEADSKKHRKGRKKKNKSETSA